MKRLNFFALVPVLLVAAWLCGCDNGNSTPGSSGVTENVSGAWKLSFDVGYVINMTFEQDAGGGVQGVGQDVAGTAWSFSGKIKGDRLSGTTIPDSTWNMLVDTNVIAGTYMSSSTNGSFTGARN